MNLSNKRLRSVGEYQRIKQLYVSLSCPLRFPIFTFSCPHPSDSHSQWLTTPQEGGSQVLVGNETTAQTYSLCFDVLSFSRLGAASDELA